MTVAAINFPAEILMDSSEDLIKRVRSGDAAAFQQIYEQHHSFVLKFLYGMVGEIGLAEELTQETFVRAFTSIGKMRSEAKLSTWLGGIAKNVASNSFRSRRREKRNLEIDSMPFNEISGANLSPDAELLNVELQDIIRDALAKLSVDKRLVFVLKILQHKSYEEIAEITDSSIPKLKTDLHRAKSEMRRLIRPYLETRNEL
ncbi:MAG: sigma-70 family RNA polymerase sigma factor [Acidobacteriota bacterium]|nr:sigma-70 family RNA polymerase sigma factor [Acidobacteriota bacterium]